MLPGNHLVDRVSSSVGRCVYLNELQALLKLSTLSANYSTVVSHSSKSKSGPSNDKLILLALVSIYQQFKCRRNCDKLFVIGQSHCIHFDTSLIAAVIGNLKRHTLYPINWIWWIAIASDILCSHTFWTIVYSCNGSDYTIS